MSTLIFNNVKGIVQVYCFKYIIHIKTCAITIPGFGDYTSNLISDLKILFDVQDKPYGYASKIIANAGETFFYNPKGNQHIIDDHKQYL